MLHRSSPLLLMGISFFVKKKRRRMKLNKRNIESALFLLTPNYPNVTVWPEILLHMQSAYPVMHLIYRIGKLRSIVHTIEWTWTQLNEHNQMNSCYITNLSSAKWSFISHLLCVGLCIVKLSFQRRVVVLLFNIEMIIKNHSWFVV